MSHSEQTRKKISESMKRAFAEGRRVNPIKVKDGKPWCRYCHQYRPREDFLENAAYRTGVYQRCKPCAKEEDYKRRRAFSIHKQCLLKLGNKCVRCGFDDVRALQIDHVHGGGKQDIKSFGNQWRRYYRAVLADTTGKYQCLCANCNWIKKSEQKEGTR